MGLTQSNSGLFSTPGFVVSPVGKREMGEERKKKDGKEGKRKWKRRKGRKEGRSNKERSEAR